MKLLALRRRVAARTLLEGLAARSRPEEAPASKEAHSQSSPNPSAKYPRSGREKSEKAAGAATRPASSDEEHAAHGRQVSLLISALALVWLTGCLGTAPLKGGRAATTIRTGAHTNAVTLAQSDSPKEPSRQTVQSEQTLEYVLPPGTLIPLSAPMPAPIRTSTSPAPTPSANPNREFAMLQQPAPVRLVIKDRTETSIGAAQKDTMREWARKAANLQPVMWAGIAMMTVVAGVLAYYGWWTKAALAITIGIGMVVLAQTLPDHGGIILFTGLALFGLLALLVLYAYHKGQLDRNANGIPDFLERDREVQV